MCKSRYLRYFSNKTSGSTHLINGQELENDIDLQHGNTEMIESTENLEIPFEYPEGHCWISLYILSIKRWNHLFLIYSCELVVLHGNITCITVSSKCWDSVLLFKIVGLNNWIFIFIHYEISINFIRLKWFQDNALVQLLIGIM